MARPPLRRDDRDGLTTSEVAKQLGVSPSYVRKLLAKGYFPKVKDGSGVYRFNPHNVAEVARKIGRVVKTDGTTVQKIWGYFIAPGFEPTNEMLGRIVFETGEHPDTIQALWERYKIGFGSPAAAAAAEAEAREVERLSREYDEQIKAMDEELARKRRAVFIPSPDSHDDAPPSSR